MTGLLPGTPRYFAWLYSEPAVQTLLAALFGIEAEINAALAPGLEHSVAHVRMTWWAEEAQRLRAGHALQPLSRTLLAHWPRSVSAGSGPDIAGLVEDAAWDLARATFDTRPELTLYCERWGRAMIQTAAAATLSDLPPAAAQELALRFGAPLCELQMLVSLEESARHGMLRLPLQDLEARGIEPDVIARPPWPPELCELLRQRHRELREALAGGAALLRAPAHRATLRGLLVWAALIEQYSRRAETALPRIWQRTRWDGISDALRAWRAARRAMRP